MVLVFIVFFALFGYVIFPNTHMLHASNEWIDQMKVVYPSMRYLIALLANWSFALFYVFSELWGTIGLSVLFWQFANEITAVKEAKRFYPLFGFLGNFGVILSGLLLVALTRMTEHLPDTERWGISLNWIIASVIGGALVLMFTHAWIKSNVIEDQEAYDKGQSSAAGSKKSKVKLSFMESLKLVMKSKYLGFLAILVIAYGMTINFVEATFKNQVKMLYSNPSDMTEFLGWYSTATGIVTVILMLVGANLTRTLSWRTCALITPMTILVAGSAFFTLILFRSEAAIFLGGIDPLLLAVGIGAFLVIASKGAKYSLFDPTKEMAYIPLPDELRTQGKAAVDGVGGRLGKSAGGIVQQMFFIFCLTATQASIAPYLGIFLIAMCLLWIFSVWGLSKMFEKNMAESQSKITEKENKS